MQILQNNSNIADGKNQLTFSFNNVICAIWYLPKGTEASANMSFKRLHEQEKHYDIVAYKKAVPDNRNGSLGGDLSLADAVSCIRLFRNFAPIVIGRRPLTAPYACTSTKTQ